MNFDPEIERALTKIKAIEESQDPHIDGRALGTAAKLIFYAGVGKKEITELKIKEVLSGNKIVDQINLGNTQIHLPEGIKEVLRNYIDDIRTKPGSIGKDSPLFADYLESSGEKKFSRHLEKFHTSFNDLHEAGIKNHYLMLTRGGADHQKSLAETAIRFRMDQRSVENRLKGITNPAGHRPLDEQTLVGRIMYYIGEVQKLTDYEILIEGKVQKLLIDFYNLVDSNQALSKDGVWWKDFFVKHMIESVHRSPIILKKIDYIKVKRIERGLSKDKEVAALKNTLLTYIEGIKKSLTASERVGLEDRKRALDAIGESRKTKMGKKEESGYISFPRPSLTEMREQYRRYLSEVRREEKWRRRGGGKVSPQALRNYLKAIQERELHPPPRRTYWVIEKVDMRKSTIIVILKDSKERGTFVVENTTKITQEGKRQLSFTQPRQGMSVSIVGRLELDPNGKVYRVATHINVYTPR